LVIAQYLISNVCVTNYFSNMWYACNPLNGIKIFPVYISVSDNFFSISLRYEQYLFFTQFLRKNNERHPLLTTIIYWSIMLWTFTVLNSLSLLFSIVVSDPLFLASSKSALVFYKIFTVSIDPEFTRNPFEQLLSF